MQQSGKDINQFIGALKHSILQSQYNAARLVNTQLVQLYFFLGAAISQKVKQANWGDKVLETISSELQKELKHLKGFSAQNLKKMKIFYEAYPLLLDHCPLAHQLLNNTDIQQNIFGSPVANQIENEIGSTLSNQLEEYFWTISFTNHFSILNKAKTLDERLFYIAETAKNNWSKRVLANHLKKSDFRSTNPAQ